MVRKKIVIDGEEISSRLNLAITPAMERHLDAICLITGSDRTEILRDLLGQFIKSFCEKNSDNPIVEAMKKESSDAVVNKLSTK
jgi:hypothetical protein